MSDRLEPEAISEATQQRRWRPTIVVALIVGFGGLVALPILATNILTLFALRQNTEELLADFAVVSLNSIAERVDLTFRNAKSQTTYLAEQVRKGDFEFEDHNAIQTLLHGALSGTPHVKGIGYFSPSGLAVRVGRLSAERVGYIKSDWRDEPNIQRFVEELKQGQYTDSRTLVFVPSLNEPAVTQEGAIALPGEPFQGVFSSVVGLRAISEFLVKLAEEHDGTPFVLQGDFVVAHPNMAVMMPPLGTEKPAPRIGEVGDFVLGVLNQPRFEIDNFDQIFGKGSAFKGRVLSVPSDNGDTVEKVVITRTLEGFEPEPWTIGIYYDADSVNEQINRMIAAGALIGIATVIVVIGGLWFGRRIATPIRQFSESAAAIETLDFADVPEPKRSFLKEIDETALRFNAMVRALRSLESYVPKPLVKRLMRVGEEGVIPETRLVTIMFTDIVGFTRYSETKTAEEVARFLNNHFALVTEEIARRGGTVDKYIGDSVMAFWGALEDDPDQARNALNAALGIREALSGQEVQIRIGIHQGPVVAGAIGSLAVEGGRVNYTIVGDAVNVAQRLEGLGRNHPHESGVTITLSKEIADVAPDGLIPVAVGEEHLKGREERVLVYRL